MDGVVTVTFVKVFSEVFGARFPKFSMKSNDKKKKTTKEMSAKSLEFLTSCGRNPLDLHSLTL